MSTDLLTTLAQKLDESTARYTRLDAYFEGTQPLSYLSPEDRAALENRLQQVTVNVPRLLVESVAERLRIVGIDGADVWPAWLEADLDQQAGIVHREALALGSAFTICWADRHGRPSVSAESAKQVAILVDTGTRQTLAALKRWETPTSTEVALFEPEQVTRYTAPGRGATTAGYRVRERLDNPLGVVPVVRFANSARILDEGRSEMEDVLALTDALVKLSTDMLMASEFVARPRRYATGVSLTEEPVLDEDGNETGEVVETNPYPETDRMLIAEEPEARFGSLPGSDLASYERAINVVLRQISAVSGLPEHQLALGADNPTSADAIRASEAALTARAEARQTSFGRSWETVARLIVGIRDGVDPAGVEARVRWADAATRSVAQEADAIVKLYGSGLLPASYALARLGYTEDEVAQIARARLLDTVAGANPIGVTR